RIANLVDVANSFAAAIPRRPATNGIYYDFSLVRARDFLRSEKRFSICGVSVCRFRRSEKRA
ncbi:hypothetical protein U1Q18_050207, partial [Sarracenia purpurea var. burkii]